MGDNNSSSDDEVQKSTSSDKIGSKKLKLNDGSSQDSFKEAVPSSTKDENVDSGVSADKSESTSSDDKSAGVGEGPANEVVSIAPSSSNIQDILMNIRRPRMLRNYRKRRTIDRDTDSNPSSQDSDDLSAEETPQASRLNDNMSDTESDIADRYMELLSPSSSNTSSSAASNDSMDSYESDDLVRMHAGDTDSDEGPWSTADNPTEQSEENKGKPPPVLLKERPKHNYVILREIINREMGITFLFGKATKEDVMFENKFYGSLHAVYRMKKLHQLNKHRGCVNSINFHPEGKLLVSGSDDTNIVIWDWARNAALHTVKTGHKSNVFQSKFLHLNAQSQLNIVTCARDGQVRLIQTSPAGESGGARRRLASHARAAHKLHVGPREPHLVLSAGEDGLALLCDVRAERPSRLFVVKERNSAIPLYSIHGHPLDPKEVVVAGKDKFIRVYDRRKSVKPLAMYCPASFYDQMQAPKNKIRLTLTHLTCAVYNHDGSRILGSYNDEDIYLFDTRRDAYDKDSSEPKEGFTHRYSGHRNSATFKGVTFFGPRSEYIVSGSDCAHIYIWDRETEAIVQWMHGDEAGVVNCIEAHPRFPVLATSGLDQDVKIWTPRAQHEPNYDGMEAVIRENNNSQLRSPLFNDFLPTLYSTWRSENRLFSDDENRPFGGNIDFEGNVCTTF